MDKHDWFNIIIICISLFALGEVTGEMQEAKSANAMYTKWKKEDKILNEELKTINCLQTSINLYQNKIIKATQIEETAVLCVRVFEDK